MRVTQKDIAKNLGISLITVSRALNETGYVSKELREKILEYARENNYTPHKASQALVRNTVRRIALFSSSLPEYFWNDIKVGIDLAVEQIEMLNYQTTYVRLPEGDTALFLEKLDALIEEGLDGAGFVYQHQYHMELVIARLEKAGIPYVTFNVDAPNSRRISYIGSNYEAGGRLAAEFIGKTLTFKQNPSVLVINLREEWITYSDAPVINTERLRGFSSTMKETYPHISYEIALITTHYQPELKDSQIEDLLRSREGKFDAVYLIPAFNDLFLEAIEKLHYQDTITVLHDIDPSAIHHLETHILSAAIYQNPILQGYYTVRTLEKIIDSPAGTEYRNIEIVHDLIMSENRHLVKNLYAFTQFAD